MRTLNEHEEVLELNSFNFCIPVLYRAVELQAGRLSRAVDARLNEWRETGGQAV